MMSVREYVDLKEYNTFGIPACCRYFVESDDAGDLLDFVKTYELNPDEILILGGGSNLLMTSDFPGVVIYPQIKGYEVVREEKADVWVRVGAGVVWDEFVEWAVEHHYGGVENLSKIPGHVGATPVQNIGAYGVEVGERIFTVECIDVLRGETMSFNADECRFGYRDSIFKHEWKNKYIITHVTYRLDKTPEFILDYGAVREEVDRLGEVSLEHIREAIIRIRESKLPDVKLLPNGGSFFKNPVVDHEKAEQLGGLYPGMPVYPLNENSVKLAAGWLIEAAGWKGKCIGHAGVHDKQALVLVNKGGATGVEVAHLANEIKKAVFLKFGIWLEPEVNIL